MRCFCTGGGPLDGKTIELDPPFPTTKALEYGTMAEWTYHAMRWEWDDGSWAIAYVADTCVTGDRDGILAAFERDPTLVQPPTDKS